MDLDLAERNRQDLFNQGLWGVPSWKLGDFVTWGYDRRWMIEKLLSAP
jgi:2-hydroxychromene-2-carboxylate isomerase